MKTRYPNKVEFQVSGNYALFSDPITRVGGEKLSYQIPTYEAIKGILSSIYWKPTFKWYVDEIRVMKPIRTEARGVRTLRYTGGNSISCYTYLTGCVYQVRAHFEWNDNRPELACDRNENKHHNIAKRSVKRGGRRDIFLGTRECQAYVEPCVFGEGESYYDDAGNINFGLMYHGITYPDEAYSEETKGRKTINFWSPVMRNGIIKFVRPEECPFHKYGPQRENGEEGPGFEVFETGKNMRGVDDEYKKEGMIDGTDAEGV